MASIHKGIVLDLPPERVWDVIRDIGAVHRRLAPGFVVDVILDRGARIVTFANGMVVRELIVDIDDKTRRMAYAAVGGLAAHHHASMQVCREGEGRSRLRWVTDVLPNDVAAAIRPLVEEGARVMQRTLEGMPARAD